MNISLCHVKHYQEIDKLKQHPENPRKIEPERLDLLKRSILKKGFYQPLLVWKRGNIVLSGNHRLLAVQELQMEGYTFDHGDKKQVLPVVVVDCSKDEALNILLEANNHYADWVEDQLIRALKDVEDLADTGFSEKELDKLLKTAKADVDEALEKANKELADNPIIEKLDPVAPGEDDVPKDPKKIISAPGDVWVCGNHKVVCADSTAMDSMQIFTDEPAQMAFATSRHGQEEALTALYACVEGFVFWHTSYTPKHRNNYLNTITPFIDTLHETIVWEKKPTPVEEGLSIAADIIFCFKNGGKQELASGFNLWKCSSVGNDKGVPVALSETAILLATSEGDLVFDPFLGYGSTLIACEKTKRKCYAIESESRLCDIAVERWERFTGKKAFLESTGQLFSDMK